MAIPSRRLAALGGMLVLLVILFGPATNASTEGQGTDPCERFPSHRGLRISLVSPESEPNLGYISARPSQILSFAVRYDICTIAMIPSLAGRVDLQQDEEVLSLIRDSARLSAPTAAKHQLDASEDGSHGILTLSAEQVDQASEINLEWRVKVSDCVPIGSPSRIVLHSTIEIPVGDPRADGSYEYRTIEDTKDIAVNVAPHPSTIVPSFRTSLLVSDMTPSPGWTEEYQIWISNVGTAKQRRGILLTSDPDPNQVAPLITAIPRTYLQETVTRATGKRTLPREMTDEPHDWYVEPAPGETVIISWTDQIAANAPAGTVFAILAAAGHDTDGDGRALGEDEVAQARSTITIDEQAKGVTVDLNVTSATGQLGYFVDDPVIFTIRVRNSGDLPASDLTLTMQSQYGLTYEPGSASFAYGRAQPQHALMVTDDWVNGMKIPRLDPYEEFILRYRATINDGVARAGDVLEAYAYVRDENAFLADASVEVEVSGRASLRFSVDAVGTALPGSVVTYTVKLANDGDGSLQEAIFSVDSFCGMSYVAVSERVSVRPRDPVRGGIGIRISSAALANYLADPGRDEAFVLDDPIEPGEVVEISFKMKLDEDMPFGTILSPTFHAVGLSVDGYQLESAKHVLAVGDETATKGDLEKTRKQLNKALRYEVTRLEEAIGQPRMQNGEGATSLWSAIEKTQEDVEENQSLIEQLLDWDWFGLETGAAVLGLLVGTIASWFWRRGWLQDRWSQVWKWSVRR